jgi:hypothetical protein
MRHVVLSGEHNSRFEIENMDNMGYIHIVNTRIYSASAYGVLIQVSASDQESRFPSPVPRQGN